MHRQIIKIKMFYVNKDPFEKLKIKFRSILNQPYNWPFSWNFLIYRNWIRRSSFYWNACWVNDFYELNFYQKMNLIFYLILKNKIKIKSIKFNQNKILSNIYKDKKFCKINMVLLKNIIMLFFIKI